jgi:CRP/FNR family transcriptional regulator, cyclic AMP receptor protein
LLERAQEMPMLGDDKRAFDAQAFLSQAGPGRSPRIFRKKEFICVQGDPATALFYLQNGRTKLTVLSEQGKEAAITLLGAGDFIGENCIASHWPVHTASAMAITECTVMRIEKRTMLDVLHHQPEVSDLFISYLVARNDRVQDALVDQLFNSAERRLARILLSLVRFGRREQPAFLIPRISQETLAEMVGTSRPRVNILMNRFKRQGFVEYHSELELKVHSSRLNQFLHR